VSRKYLNTLGKMINPPVAQRRRWISSEPKSGGVAL
jgi:hypothetical protein